MTAHKNDIDLQLIAKYKSSGELEVLGELFTPYTHLVYGVCLKYLQHREEARERLTIPFFAGSKKLFYNIQSKFAVVSVHNGKCEDIFQNLHLIVALFCSNYRSPRHNRRDKEHQSR